MSSFLYDLFDTSALAPHGFCLLWKPELVWLHVASDTLIGLAYYSIPIVLAYFVSKRRDVAFGWVFWAFAVFILACGTTHWFSIWTLWHPDYGAEGIVKAVTALASVLTAIGLLPLLPQALALPSPDMLRQANETLQIEIREREEALAALERERAEHQKTEAMLHQAQKMEAVGQLTAGIAHDFNNLLTVVFVSLERLGKRLPAEDRDSRRSVQNAIASAERAAALTQQLLAFGRRQPLRPTVLDLNEIIAATADLLRRTLPDHVAVHTRLAPNLALTRVDPNQFESALVNLAVNARDAMAEGGVLTIETRNETVGAADDPDLAPGEYVLVEVSDTGCGMTPEVLEHAVEPFFTTKMVGQGSGLGLSQVYGFIKQSNGHVVLESQQKRGTTLRLYLPRAAAPDPIGSTLREAEATREAYVLQGAVHI